MTDLDQITATALDMAVRFGPRVLVAVIILVAGFVAGRWLARSTTRMLARFRLEPPVAALLERIVWALVVGLFAIMALQNLGVELLPLIAGIGVAGAGIALAMQGVLSNVVAGLTIIFTRPFRVGDYIAIVGVEGEVLEIKLFSTTLGHADLSKVVVPNRKIVGEILHNHGRMRQIALEVAVAGEADLGQAIEVVQRVLHANSRVLRDPAPVVAITRLANGAATIAVRPWTSVPDYGAAVGEVNRAIQEAFRELRIPSPVPQRDIRLVAGGAALADAALSAGLRR
jgi:small conductance mechanosensitive channel